MVWPAFFSSDEVARNNGHHGGASSIFAIIFTANGMPTTHFFFSYMPAADFNTPYAFRQYSDTLLLNGQTHRMRTTCFFLTAERRTLGFEIFVIID